MTKKLRSKTPARTTYRHGDLRRALLEAGIALARAGGPSAIVLREATRRAGVVPNAAYRHFASRQDLLEAVRSAALSELAKTMEAEIAKVRRGKSAGEAARAKLRAVGTGYLRFAFTETGLFRTAFAAPEPLGFTRDPARKGASGLDPLELLGAALDDLTAAGLLPLERRPGAEFLAWSSVHGFAMLVINGPLHTVPRSDIDAIGARVVAMVEKGL
ncbi:TetR/AcrR family transcriptional regulator [Dongia deserti]|uniref:TetR/AcrR family transcriptional regulator n=1 Tax=Dongia deserti TaxID=2268030 RepID=UPI000E64E720|nr:TetR/AcrR family transcriptional regulator [Dongia deserti]